MISYRVVTFALALCGFSTIANAGEAAECTLKQLGSTEFEIRDNTIILPAIIGETQTHALLNLTSVLNTVGPDDAETLDLPLRNLPNTATVRVAGKVVRRYAPSTMITIGNVRFRAEVLVTTGTAPPLEFAPVRIGMNLFDNTDFELDMAHRKLNLFSQDHCVGKVIYWASFGASAPMRRGKIGETYFIMELDGRKLESSIDSSLAITTLHGIAAKELYGIDRTVKAEQFMELTAPGLSVMNAQVAFREEPSGCGFQEKTGVDEAAGYSTCMNTQPLNLGMNVLSKLRLYFATKERVLYFTTADATN